MVSSMFMCLRYKAGQMYSKDLPIFFKFYNQAKKYANKNAIIKFNTHYIVKIFKINFKYHVCLNALDADFYENYIETVYDPKTTKVMLIQKRWRNIYQKRVDSANIIKEHFKIAIANPNTQLCKNRLLHEFYDMV